MARKLYIFGIGGTGSRVIKALSMLFASGVKLDNGFDTVIPIIIDPDTSNGDLNRTKDILRLYQEIRNQVKDPDDFYRQEIKTINELATDSKVISPDYFQFKLDGVDSSTFSQFIGFDSLCDDYKKSKDDKSFLKLLYSESNLNSDLSVGFKGNPNMGAIVLNQFTNSEDFKRFGQTFGSEDAIFIINSIFGGTGAAGFPLLLKNLRGNDQLPRYAQIKDAPIGGITYLPYFTLNKQDEINAESFEEKAKIAIDYYNRTIINQKKINVLHFIGNRGNTNAEEYAVGGNMQRNKAHFLELAGALAIMEFCKNIAQYSCEDGITKEDTVVREFGIEQDVENISFDDLNIENKNQFYRQLTKFRLFTQYLNEGLNRAKNVSRWTKSNILFVRESKESPLNEKHYFAESEYKNQIEAFNAHFIEWVNELAKNKPAFNPFFEIISTELYKNIDTQNCLLIDNTRLRSKEKIHTALIKIFGLSTEKIYKKLPIKTSQVGIRKNKVFRLHQGQNGTGWFKSSSLDKEDFKTIKTEGRDVATSIPSTFGRIDLVKSAYQWIVDQVSEIESHYNNGAQISNEDQIRITKIIEGNTAQHKLVSDSLDIAQLFYNYPRYKDKIEIVAWKPQERFKDLIENSQNRKHTRLAETLKIFWDQDSVPPILERNLILYNFEHVNRLYFVINKNTKQVIGGSSPATLFFASPDVKTASKNLNITCGQDVLFDDIYFSLNKRETSFIEYMYALAEQDENFSSYFPEVYSYFDKVKNYLLQPSIQTIVSDLDNLSINKYSVCPVLSNDNDPCEVIGLRLGVTDNDGNLIENQSDFVIKSDFEDFTAVWDRSELKYKRMLTFPDGTYVKSRPLVLPTDKFSKQWNYTTNGIIWNENTKVPLMNEKEPGKSILPVQGDNYYWLSEMNFLEDKIIELPYTIDNLKFKTCGARKHLLPLTPLFFQYFSSEKVSHYLKLEELAGGGVGARLELPVRGGTILFKKTYHIEDIEKLEIHLSILPFIRVPDIALDYTLGVIDDRIERKGDIIVKCYEKGKEVILTKPIIRNPGNDDVKSYYYNSKENFDLCGIFNNSSTGFIVPTLKSCGGNGQITFAIDFGTTNSHIEYVAGENVAVPLDNQDQNPFWQSLINRKDKAIDPQYLDNEKTFEQEMLPYSISNSQDQLHFPFRTALVHNKQVNFNENLEVFRHTNNYLLFEKRNVPNYLELHTQLKWSNYSDTKDEKKVESYIEYLMKLVFYKTLLLGGDITQTKIIWFYPVSMDGAENSDGELGVFIRIWGEVFMKVFGLNATENLIRMPESIAPYLYYKPSVEGLSLSIDIGGGSSDIAVFDEQHDNAILISSFKFAGNAIFGDGFPTKEFKNNSDRNGFVKSFLNDAKKAVGEDEQKKAILNNIVNIRKDSADFSSFLFSLEQDKTRPFSYTRLFEKNKRLKLSLLVFYSAIAYYSAKLLKKSGIDIPEHILLSGTASKTASILDSEGSSFSNLSSMFKFIFEKVYSSNSSGEIDVKLSSIPKEITCKGALNKNALSSIRQNTIKFWIGGAKDNNWGSAVDKEKDVHKTPKYKELDDAVKSEIRDSLIDFYSILDEYVNSIRLESKYIIELDAYDVFKSMRDKNIPDYLLKGINAYFKKGDKHVEETLFFYPLIGILNKLSFELSENKKNEVFK